MAKWAGELSEMKFQVRATENRLVCSKPFGDLQTYDFLTDSGMAIHRVQVKSTNRKRDRGYAISLERNKHKKYEPNDFDVVACYIKPFDVWYLIPMRKIKGTQIKFYPHLSGVGRYEQYREDWEVLR